MTFHPKGNSFIGHIHRVELDFSVSVQMGINVKSLIITRIMPWNPQSGLVILFKKFLTENSYLMICLFKFDF